MKMHRNARTAKLQFWPDWLYYVRLFHYFCPKIVSNAHFDPLIEKFKKSLVLLVIYWVRRMNNHRNKSHTVDEKSTFELKHFNIHEFPNVKIKIIEQIVDEDFCFRSENFYTPRFKIL